MNSQKTNPQTMREYPNNAPRCREYADLYVIEQELTLSIRLLKRIKIEIKKPEKSRDNDLVSAFWGSAIILLWRAYDKRGSGRSIHFSSDIFKEFTGGAEAFEWVKKHRHQSVVHDVAPTLQSLTIVGVTPDSHEVRVGTLAAWFVPTSQMVEALGKMTALTIHHVRKQAREAESNILEFITKNGGNLWISSLKEARLGVTDGKFFSENRKQATYEFAAWSRSHDEK